MFCAVVGAHFTFCSFWIYHYVDIDEVDREMDEEGENDLELEENNQFGTPFSSGAEVNS
jgi:hypothetical protein